MTWCVLDLETQNHEYYGSLASPHHAQNYIVAAAFAHDDAEVQSWYFNSAEEAASSDWLQAALADQEIMEGTPKWLCEHIPAYKDWRYDTTPFPAAGEYGLNMMEKKHIE